MKKVIRIILLLAVVGGGAWYLWSARFGHDRDEPTPGFRQHRAHRDRHLLQGSGQAGGAERGRGFVRQEGRRDRAHRPSGGGTAAQQATKPAWRRPRAQYRSDRNPASNGSGDAGKRNRCCAGPRCGRRRRVWISYWPGRGRRKSSRREPAVADANIAARAGARPIGIARRSCSRTTTSRGRSTISTARGWTARPRCLRQAQRTAGTGARRVLARKTLKRRARK